MNIWQVFALQFTLSDSPSCSHSWFALGDLVLVLFGAVRFLLPDFGNIVTQQNIWRQSLLCIPARWN